MRLSRFLEKINSFKKGLELSLLNGTTCVAQLSKESKYFDVLNETPLKTFLFFELFSDSVDSSKEEFRAIQKKIEKLKMQKSKCSGLDFKMKEKFHQSTYKTEYCRKRGFTQMLDNKIDEN